MIITVISKLTRGHGGLCSKVMVQNFYLKHLQKLFWAEESLVESWEHQQAPDSHSEIDVVCGSLNGANF